jgi:cyclophilin family peptidyl-prolyl cis-trans isomerase
MIAPVRATLAAALVLSVAAGAAPRAARAEEESPEAPIPSGHPVSLDGIVLAGEWEDAAAHPLGPPGLVLRAKQVRGTLLLALETGRPWPSARASLLFVSRPGGEEGKPGDPGSFRLDYEALEHNRPHAIVERVAEGGRRRDDEGVVVRSGNLAGAASVEAAIPLSLLGVAGSPPPPLRWFVLWTDPTREPSSATFPRGLDVRGGFGPPPRDFQTTARWARTAEWVKHDGPGALSRTEWDALVAADREMARRGAAAHGMARALRRDEGAPLPGEPTKRDGPVESELFGNLRWIAEREPLTPTDLRAMATGHWRLNRYDEALALLDSVALGRTAWRGAETAYLRALVCEDAERFEEAAVAWETVAERAPSPASYRARVRLAREKQAALDAERAARREDEAKDLPLALLRTARGDVVLRLLEDDVPHAVAQFVHLVEAEKGKDGAPFYDGTLFHRVVPNRFAQGGDPKSRTEGCEAAGDGGASWFVEAEENSRHGFFRGAVAFAHRGDRKNRGQFFVVTGHPETDLAAQGFTCFATVVSGLDVASRLEACDALHSVAILRKRPHAYEPKKSY